MNNKTLTDTLYKLGLSSVASEVGRSVTAVHYWAKNGALPYTDYLGTTDFSGTISAMSGVPRHHLLRRE
jgi:hypothetical protein